MYTIVLYYLVYLSVVTSLQSKVFEGESFMLLF